MKGKLADGEIQTTILSCQETKEKLTEDLHFLALVRMYFAFYKNSRMNQSYYQQLMGLNKTQFSHVINGEVERVPPGVWINTVNFLRSKLKENIREFQKDLGLGAAYFIQAVDQLPHYRIKRFQH